jgi:hypothetical protein
MFEKQGIKYQWPDTGFYIYKQYTTNFSLSEDKCSVEFSVNGKTSLAQWSTMSNTNSKVTVNQENHVLQILLFCPKCMSFTIMSWKSLI